VLSDGEIVAAFVGKTAHLQRRHRFRPGSLSFALTFRSPSSMHVRCRFVPDANPQGGGPCPFNGQTMRWSRSGGRVCWDFNSPVCFQVATNGGSYVLRGRGMMRGPIVLR
jgi:hypothetical protein